MAPQYVTAGASLPASVRYWIVEGGRVDARWTSIRADENCDLCGACTRDGRLGVQTVLPDVLVMSRGAMDAQWIERARLPHKDGCGSEPKASFVPPASADYALEIQFSGDPIPTPRMGESGTRFVVMPRGGLVLPLRRLRRDPDPTKWTWQIKVDGLPGPTYVIKEGFDRGLHVAKVRILQAKCNDLQNGSGPDSNGDECGTGPQMDEGFDRDAMGPAIVSVVKPLSVRAGGETTNRTCQADPRAEDGDIDFGMARVQSAGARCRPDDRATFFTPAYPVVETQAGTATIPWTVEFSAEVIAQFPGEVQREDGSTWLWIEFTLEQSP